jgi:hypothetical protein
MWETGFLTVAASIADTGPSPTTNSATITSLLLPTFWNRRTSCQVRGARGNVMPEVITLGALFQDERRHLYDAERQIVRGLPRLIRSVSADGLRTALEAHLEETRNHIERLECVFDELELRSGGTHCLGMAGIFDEVQALMDDGAAAGLEADAATPTGAK